MDMMMSVGNRKTKLSALLVASLISMNFVCANDAYKNNVVDVRVNKESSDAVKVTIYTDRPYTEPVVVNKKANNKYVILMPETKSTLKSAPSVTNGAGTISNVSVNTQSVAGGKGYTKIIITSEKAITVVPRTQQLVSSKPAQAKPVTQAQKPAAKPQPAKQEPKKAVQTTTTTKPKPVQTATASQQSVAQKPVQTAVVPKKEPIEVLEQEIKTGQYANIQQEKPDEILNKEIANNLSSEPQKEQTVDTSSQKSTVTENIKSVLRGYKNIGLWKLLLLAGAITFPVIVIMIILALDKKINRKIEKTFRREEDNYSDYVPAESVTSDVNNQAGEQTLYGSFDEMLDNVNEQETTYHEEQLSHTEFEEFTQALEDQTPENLDFIQPAEEYAKTEFNNDFVVDDFDADNSEAGVNEGVNYEVSEDAETEVISDTEPENIDELPAEPQLPAEPYNPDGYLADFAQVNDKDFFDELVMQTMADNNKDGLPQESPADEIFNFINEDDNAITEIRPSVETNSSNQTVSDPVQDFINQSYDNTQNVDTSAEVQTYVNGDDELTMLTEVKLNDSTGMYLVNYDNFSSLVGHINDDYFVIKKFDEIVNGRIILKETEKLKDSKRYLVRVGKNKMVVEVSDTSMDRLLDL